MTPQQIQDWTPKYERWQLDEYKRQEKAGDAQGKLTAAVADEATKRATWTTLNDAWQRKLTELRIKNPQLTEDQLAADFPKDAAALKTATDKLREAVKALHDAGEAVDSDTIDQQIGHEPPKPEKAGKGGGDEEKIGSDLGAGIIKGGLQELGFPDVFGKFFTQWGSFKLAMTGLGDIMSIFMGGKGGLGGMFPGSLPGFSGGPLGAAPGPGGNADTGVPPGAAAPAPPAPAPAAAVPPGAALPGVGRGRSQFLSDAAFGDPRDADKNHPLPPGWTWTKSKGPGGESGYTPTPPPAAPAAPPAPPPSPDNVRPIPQLPTIFSGPAFVPSAPPYSGPHQLPFPQLPPTDPRNNVPGGPPVPQNPPPYSGPRQLPRPELPPTDPRNNQPPVSQNPNDRSYPGAWNSGQVSDYDAYGGDDSGSGIGAGFGGGKGLIDKFITPQQLSNITSKYLFGGGGMAGQMRTAQPQPGSDANRAAGAQLSVHNTYQGFNATPEAKDQIRTAAYTTSSPYVANGAGLPS
jgi:hypothetical protein